MTRVRGGSIPGQAALFADPATTDAPTRPLLSAAELSRRLGQPHPPTPEQARAIEHLGADGRPEPYLVVAGAGSGKTETMAARVVWLVANGLVRPERILGLTFTRKAAGELAERIRKRLAQLARSGVVPPGVDDDWLAGEPVVSTYNAYAAGLFGEHAVRIGREPSARLLGEAVTWQYAGRVVSAFDGDMSEIEWQPATVVAAVRALAGELAEHLVTTEDVRQRTEEILARVEALPPVPRTKSRFYADTIKFQQQQRRRLQLLPLVEAYAQRKRDTESLDYGDQVALAARIAAEHPDVGAGERARYDVVLLDEYQDTGTAQRVLLSSLFAEGHAVTAVGDPCQSIYGWRGASAGNLARFPRDFPDRDGAASDRVDLTVSFRNGGRILAVANRLSEPLRAHGVPVNDLHARPGEEHSGAVRYALLEDATSEAAWVAESVARLVLPSPTGAPPPYAPHQVAVLTRARSHFERIERALRSRGVPVEVSGLGGLLSTPEVADVIATLQAVVEPQAGPALLRLLTGPRWRIGPRDLAALGRRARHLAAPTAQIAGSDVVSEIQRDPDGIDSRSLIEALDDPGAPTAYSPAGWQRLQALRAELRALRWRSDQPLPDLVADIVRTTRLDVEVAARPGADRAAARAHLDRFLDVAAEFAETQEAPSVLGFIAYLDAAAEYERGLEAGRVRESGNAVQLLTMHGAKGLEWPVVVVPGLTEQVFPSRPRESTDWCSNAKTLPFMLRGDVDELPVLGLAECADQKDVRDALVRHKDECAARALLEERRLMYVAATRAQHLLLCSGYWWDHTTSPRGPSEFLTEIRAVAKELGIGEEVVWAPEPEDGEENPLDTEPVEVVWPRDPLSPDDRAALEAAADLVARARGRSGDLSAAHPARPLDVSDAASEAVGGAEDRAAGLAADDADRLRTWTEEVDRLLAERARLAGGAGSVIDVPLPTHLSVSQLVALRRDPDALARWLRRPVPAPPAPLARRGTAFHAWLEQRFGGGRLLDIDELPGSADVDAAPDADLALLKERFLASEWAGREPAPGGVEVPFEMTVEGVVVRGRMDAVFRSDDGWEVVDWKTGARPTGAEARAVAVQLAAYRLAWHRLTGAPLESIRAAFFYVRSGETVAPADLLDADGIADLLSSVPDEVTED